MSKAPHDNRIRILAIITVVLIWVGLLYRVLSPTPIAIDAVDGDSQIHLSIDRNVVVSASDCLIAEWDVQHVLQVFVNQQGVAGTDSREICAGLDAAITLRVELPDGRWYEEQLPVTVLSESTTFRLAIWGSIVLLSIGVFGLNFRRDLFELLARPTRLASLKGGFPLNIPPRIRARAILAIAFLVFSLHYLPALIHQAKAADEATRGTVPTIGDDQDYQIPAVNLLLGKGYTTTLYFELEEVYHLDVLSEWGRHQQARLDEEGIVLSNPSTDFYRAPGFSMFLSLLYSVFGDSTLVARLAFAILVWLIALMLPLIGILTAGWTGGLAGGLAGILYIEIYVIRDSGSFERILTEIPATFWVTLFGLLFVLYLRRRSYGFLVLAVLGLVATIYTRANFLVVLPLMVVYLYFSHRSPRRHIVVFTILAALPVLAWSAYVSGNVGKLTGFTTQGEIAFPQYNNIDVVEGVGPNHILKGEWNPGWELDEYGNPRRATYEHAPQGSENGYVKGFRFWLDNPTRLPELFYLKLQAGFWHFDSAHGNKLIRYLLMPIYEAGIGFLLVTLAFHKRWHAWGFLPHLTSGQAISLQLLIILVVVLRRLVFAGDYYVIVLIGYVAVLLIAIMYPVGKYYPEVIVDPTWFLAFVVSHFLTTILFMGVRFHEPLDPLLLTFGVLGGILLVRGAIGAISTTAPKVQ